jgi:serine protease AprX
VALIDSGVSNHLDLDRGILPLSRVVYQQSFVPGNSSASDQYGHGTHVAGLIAGDGLSSTGIFYTKTFKGIAPGANIVNLRVLDENGAGTDSEVIAAINQAISLKSQYNIRVINLSLGRAVYESYKLDPLCQAVEKAWQNGIVVVVAAGNNGRYQPTDGYATVTSPGNDPYVITVGAMKPMGTPTRWKRPNREWRTARSRSRRPTSSGSLCCETLTTSSDSECRRHSKPSSGRRAQAAHREAQHEVAERGF